MEKSNKRTTNRKKSTSRKKKKAKVYIPLNSVISLCAIVVGICTAFLLIYSFSTSVDFSHRKKEQTIVKKQQKENEIKKAPELTLPLESPKKKAPQVAVKPQNNENKIKNLKKTEAAKTEVKKTLPEKKVQEPVKIEQNKQKEEIKAPLQKTSDIPYIPPAVNSAKLVIVFDDGGQNLNQLAKCLALPFPVTVAVLPRLPHSRESAEKVRVSGNEVILHQPMQSVNPNVNPGAGAVKPGMSEDEIRTLLFQNINEIAPVTGMNNHEGSLITADREQISYVMKVASDEGIFFLDSRTNSETQVPYVANALGYSYYERNIFLDNKKTRENIISEFMKGLSIANKNGAAIMIGHVWSAEILPGVLAELYPLVKEKGYRFTTVSNSGALITP